MIVEFGVRMSPKNKGDERWFGFYTNPDSGERVDIETPFDTKEAALDAAEDAASSGE